MQNYKYELLGRIPDENAIVGTLNHDGTSRIVTVVLTEDLTDHQRRERLNRVRARLGGEIISMMGRDPSLLKSQFDMASAPEMKAQIKYPEYTDHTLQLILEESNAAIIQLSCHDKDGFWNCLRTLGTTREEMLAVAELGGLVIDERNETISKPVGNAHKVCDYFAKIVKKLGKHGEAIYGSEIYGEERRVNGTFHNQLIAKIRAATKIRLPDFDFSLEGRAGRFHLQTEKVNSLNDLMSQETDESRRNKYAERIKAIKNEWETLYGEKFDKAHYPDSIFYYPEEHSQIGNEECKELISDYHRYEKQKIKMRDGFHLMPSTNCYFETKFSFSSSKLSAQGLTVDFHILMEDKEDFIEATFLQYQQDRITLLPVQIHGHKENGRITNPIKFVELFSGGKPPVHKVQEGFEICTKILFIRALNALTRYNDPDFSPHWQTPEPRQQAKMRMLKHEPYFQYLEIHDPAAFRLVRHLDSQNLGGTHSSPVLHRRRGHPRRLFDKNGNVKGITIIPPTLAGDPSKGVLSKSVDMKFEPR